MRNWTRHLDSSRNVVLLCLKLHQRFFRCSGTLNIRLILLSNEKYTKVSILSRKAIRYICQKRTDRYCIAFFKSESASYPVRLHLNTISASSDEWLQDFGSVNWHEVPNTKSFGTTISHLTIDVIESSNINRQLSFAVLYIPCFCSLFPERHSGFCIGNQFKIIRLKY